MERFCRVAVSQAKPTAALLCLLSWLTAGGWIAAAADESSTQQQLQQLQQQLQKQQQTIDELKRKVTDLEASGDRGKYGAGGEAAGPEGEKTGEGTSRSQPGFSLGKVRLSGEGAVGFFHSQSEGQFPNAEFRVDEAKFFIEAPIYGPVYFFTELNLFTLEEGGPSLRGGEVYLDVEDVSQLWGHDRQLSLRAGRFDIPFGEEYLRRDAIDNPLISHSLMDLWGVDEGIELYGALGKVQYVVAVQNGGHDALNDWDGDKAVIARVGADAAKWLHLSVSAMRTGHLDVQDDGVSELWLGSGLVVPIGSPATQIFEANLLEGDVRIKIAKTTVRAAGGVMQYDDDDPAANNRREIYYYYVEGVQPIYQGLYAAARWSQIFAEEGYPIAGQGDVGGYAFSGALTTKLWKLSLGLGYQFSKNLVLKAEYSFERGQEVGGEDRDHEDQVAATAAFAF